MGFWLNQHTIESSAWLGEEKEREKKKEFVREVLTDLCVLFLDLPGFTRSVYKSDHALITPESHVFGPLPEWYVDIDFSANS